MIYILLGALLIGGCFLGYQSVLKRNGFPQTLPKLTTIPEKKSIEGTLHFQDVVGWFKQIKDLNKENDIPFVADASKFEEMLNCSVSRKGLFLGIYNEKNDTISKSLLIESDDWDEKTKEVLSNDNLVVLS